MSKKLEGKIALITGGSRGIGAAIAKRLASDGAKVVITYTKGADAASLPRWHREQRKQEYRRIDARMQKPGVFFLPCTKLGRDLDFQNLCDNGGFSDGGPGKRGVARQTTRNTGSRGIHRQRLGLPECLHPSVQPQK